MRRIKALLVILLGLGLLTACGGIPIEFDLLKFIPDQYKRGSFGTEILKDLDEGEEAKEEEVVVQLPEEDEDEDGEPDGITIEFTPPENLPKLPVGVSFDFAVRVDYRITCVENPSGTIAVALYLADSPPPFREEWLLSSASAELEGAEGSFTAAIKGNLSKEQLEAVRQGKVVLGMEARLVLSGKKGEGCTSEIQGEYEIERAKVRFTLF